MAIEKKSGRVNKRNVTKKEIELLENKNFRVAKVELDETRALVLVAEKLDRVVNKRLNFKSLREAQKMAHFKTQIKTLVVKVSDIANDLCNQIGESYQEPSSVTLFKESIKKKNKD